MLHPNTIKHYIVRHTDAIIRLVDEHDDTKVLTLPVHRAVLSLLCPFFDKMFTGFKENKQTDIIVKVPNVNVAHDVIMTFYGEHNNYGQVTCIRTSQMC